VSLAVNHMIQELKWEMKINFLYYYDMIINLNQAKQKIEKISDECISLMQS